MHDQLAGWGRADRRADLIKCRVPFELASDEHASLPKSYRAHQEALMPYFYFHLRGPSGLSRDELGLDLPDMETAYLEADRAVNDVAGELQAKRLNPRSYAFEITNAAGEPVLELPFLETLDRVSRRRGVHLPKSVKVAVEQAERMMRLVSEVAQQTDIARENLRQTSDLIRMLRSGPSER